MPQDFNWLIKLLLDKNYAKYLKIQAFQPTTGVDESKDKHESIIPIIVKQYVQITEL